MDLIKLLPEIYHASGLPWLMVVLMLIVTVGVIYMSFKMVKQFNETIKNLTRAVDALIDKVQAPYLTTEQAVVLFREVMKSHIEDKLKIIGDILHRNSIRERERQVKEQIEREFKRVTKIENEKLSSFKTTAGDLGVILEESIPWNKFLKDVYKIVFDACGEHQKIKYLRSLMNVYVDKIVKIIEERGSRN